MKKPIHDSKTAKTEPTDSKKENAMKKPIHDSKTAKTETTDSKKENAMKKPARAKTTKTTIALSAEDATTEPAKVANVPVATVAPSSPSASAESPAAPSALSARTGVALTFLAPPPAITSIPTPPAGAATPSGANYRALLPKSIELAALPGAVKDLQRFTTFAQVFGVAGLAYAQVMQAFNVSNDWSGMRKATDIWDAYSQSQEGIAWGNLRLLMDRLGPLFEIAAVGDPTLASTFPSLATLLGAKKVIAQKAAGTRKLNREAIARGEAPTHGVVGKRRQKAAMKALATAARAAPPAAAVSAASGASTTAAPTATTTAPAVPPTPGTNGATH